MNTRFLKIAGLVGALGLFALAADAQTSVAKASVPFEFAASGAMLPAGEYTVEVPDLSGVLLLHGSAGNSVALLTTFSGAVPNTSNAKFIFERRNGVAYLSSVEWPNQSATVISVFKHVTKGAVAATLR
jgi:hypothetical protein